MEDSILITIKKMLGLDEDDTSFDIDIIVCINAALATLTQIGVGPDAGFMVQNESESWSELIGESQDLETVKMYVYLKTKNVFDPPTSSSVLESYKQMIQELEWRLNVQVDKA